VRAEEHRAAFVAQAENQVPDVATANGIEPRHRLVENDQLGIVDERLRDADALHHALRVMPEQPAAVGADPDLVEEPVRPRSALRPTIAEEPGEIREQFLRREVVVERRMLRQEAEAPARPDVAWRPAQDLGTPVRRPQQVDQNLERRALAGAVRSQQAEDAARRNLEGESVQGAVRT
jgi:hypothetical protein